jgi:hypothetical protein
MSSLDTWVFKVPLMLAAVFVCVVNVATALTYK